MKPAAFEYHIPDSLDVAVRLLSELGDDAQLLAGGQSLIPLMNMRLARPEHLVDLSRIPELALVKASQNDVTIGSMVRHRDVERLEEIRACNPLLSAAATHIAHFQIRERGTLGGSIAHADPSAEFPLVACLLDATMHAESVHGKRSIQASDYFISVFTTALEHLEVLTHVSFPRLAEGEGWAVEEISRRHGDFAIVAATTTVALEGGRYSEARLALGGVASTPVFISSAAILLGEKPSADLWEAVAANAARSITPPSDVHATTQDRRDIARALIVRCLGSATERAVDQSLQ